jgi:hypothetical protein
LIGIITTVSLLGCGANGPKFNAIDILQKNQSLVYVYRPSAFIGSAILYDVHVKGVDGSDIIIGTLENGGYLKYISKPERVEFWAKQNQKIH